MRHMFWPFVLSSFLLSLAVAQSSSFNCPTPSSACESYKELLQAGDKEIASPYVRYVCFRDSGDEFFVVSVVDPAFYDLYTWSHTKAEYELNLNPKNSRGLVQVHTFVNGVRDFAQEPSVSAAGYWSPTWDHLQFYGKEQGGAVSIDDSQVAFSKRYQSQTKKIVDYSLIIQRSTRRFTEGFNVENDPKAHLDNTGRCAEINLIPSLPSPPEMTDEQQDEAQGLRTKLDYCSSADFDPKDKGYCNSSYIFIEDYQAAAKKATKSSSKQTSTAGAPKN